MLMFGEAGVMRALGYIRMRGAVSMRIVRSERVEKNCAVKRHFASRQRFLAWSGQAGEEIGKVGSLSCFFHSRFFS